MMVSIGSARPAFISIVHKQTNAIGHSNASSRHRMRISNVSFNVLSEMLNLEKIEFEMLQLMARLFGCR